MTPPIAELMSDIWGRSVQAGRNIDIYLFRNVFVTAEGLVFDKEGQLIACTRTLHSDEQIDFSADALRAVRDSQDLRTIDKAVLAKSRGAENYGHFLIEMLTRAWFARTHLDLTDWPALIHKSTAAIESVAIQALQQAGYRRDQILICGQEPVFLQELIFVDGLSDHSRYLSPYVMQCLDTIADGVQAGTASKIYVTRRPAQTRDFVNEGQISACLAANGFSEVTTASLDFRSQIATFKGAGTVVGAMGAALTNLVFCKPGTDVFVFMPSSAAEVLFWMIAQVRRLNYCEIRTKETGPQTGPLAWDRALEIHPKQLARIVSGKESGLLERFRRLQPHGTMGAMRQIVRGRFINGVA